MFLSAADWEGTNPRQVKQVWLADLISGAKRRVTMETANVNEVALAANGSAAFAVTENLRLLCIAHCAACRADRARVSPHPGDGSGDHPRGSGRVAVPTDGDRRVNRAGCSRLSRVGRSRRHLAPRGWTTPVTTGNPARLGETVTARMTGMGPVYESGNTTVGFEWSAVESYFAGRGGAAYAKTAVHVIRRRATTGAGVYLVTIRLPDALHGGTYRYEGIETMLAGGREASLSRLPLRLPA